MNGFLPPAGLTDGLTGLLAGAPLEGFCRRISARRDSIFRKVASMSTAPPSPASPRFRCLAHRNQRSDSKPWCHGLTHWVRSSLGHCTIKLVGPASADALQDRGAPAPRAAFYQWRFRLSFRCSDTARPLLDRLSRRDRLRARPSFTQSAANCRTRCSVTASRSAASAVGTPVNGQLAVPVCGQLKVPTSRVVSSVC